MSECLRLYGASKWSLDYVTCLPDQSWECPSPTRQLQLKWIQFPLAPLSGLENNEITALPSQTGVPGVRQSSEKLQNPRRVKDSEAKNLRSRRGRAPCFGSWRGALQFRQGNWYLWGKEDDWCRRDEQEGAEVWGGLDPSKDPQPAPEVTEVREPRVGE